MGNAKTVSLELLRDGPSHNQLLSPLTVYLAACQNRPPESLRLAIEHRDFLRWQGGLTYADGGLGKRGRAREASAESAPRGSSRSRLDAIDDATKAVTGVLGSIRALIAELASEPCDWRHIHLVLDAAELGALPFELAHAAPGLMVEGERLFLQQNARVTLTRQTRRVANSVVDWPVRPRILCVVADGDLPVDAHVLALRQAIDPWIGWNDSDSFETPGIDRAPRAEVSDEQREENPETLRENRRREAQQMLTVIVGASLEDVSRETRTTQYTHVHILAHGAPLDDVGPGQTLYGLCFRGERGGMDVVDGDRLESALRSTHACSHPTVVTVATCEGASVSGGILGPGASVAHALHAKGIPLIVSAQFPLTKGASAIFTEMMYAGILRGEDPRKVVHAIRRELFVAYPDTHDWASLVVYASFPPDLDVQLRRVGMAAEKLAIETAVERMSVSFKRWRRLRYKSSPEAPESGRPEDGDPRLAERRKRARSDMDRLDLAATHIRRWTLSPDVQTQAKGYLLLAQMSMRVCDILAVFPNNPFKSSMSELLGRKFRHDSATGERMLSMLNPSDLLELAQECYLQVYALDGMQIEAWIQVAFTYWLLKGIAQDRPPPLGFDDFADQLNTLQRMAAQRSTLSRRLGKSNRRDLETATAAAFETALLLHLSGWGDEFRGSDGEKAVDSAFNEFVSAVSPVSSSYRAYEMWRQLRRYEAFARSIGTPGFPTAATLAKAYRNKLESLAVRKYWGPRP